MRSGVRCRAMRTRSTDGGRRKRGPVTNDRAALGYAYLALVCRGRRRAVAARERQEIGGNASGRGLARDRKSTRLNSSHSQISYAVFCLKKKKCEYHVRSRQLIRT